MKAGTLFTAGGTAPEACAEGIIEVCRFHVDAALPCAAGIGSAKLKARIEDIVANRRLRRLRRPGFAALAASVVATVATPVLLGACGKLPADAQPAPEVQSEEAEPSPSADATEPPRSFETPPPPPSEDDEILPLVRIPPEYPPRALARNVEGSVLVQFTISVNGTVKDAVIIRADPPNVFDQAALNAVSRWRYNPRIVNGEAVERVGVQTEIPFELTDPRPAPPQEPERP